MFNKIKIGDKDVPMMSMASTDVYYRQIFHQDPVLLQAGEMSEGEAIILFMQLGFVMAKYAELLDRKKVLALNENDYLEWLDQFERADYYNALGDVRATYEGQSVTTSDAKKKDVEQTGE